ncbi:Cellular retinaldehyde-binding protein [Cordyceps javanica]|nr:Cellular retinaldehyde-binding protein [Cordyceps javanica]
MAPTSNAGVKDDPVSHYLAGHYGALTAQQQEALDRFKNVLSERGYPGEVTSNPSQDIKLLRFLRARRWDAEAAYTQFHETETWRRANDIDVLYETIDSKAYKELRSLYPQWTGRRDRVGAPVYVWAPQTLNGQAVAASEKLAAKPGFSMAKSDGKTSASLICFAALYENLLRFTQPLSTQLPDRKHAAVPITLSTYIMDVSGISVLQFWSLKSHIHTLAYLASAYYPETLGTIFIVGAPPFFSTVFGWIKGWLDPVTVSKIRIVGRDDVFSALEEVVEKGNIPKKYGGDLDYTFGQAPVLDSAVKDTVRWNGDHSNFPLEPLVWEPVEGSTAQVACLRVGRQDGNPVKETVCTISQIWPPALENKS